MKGVGGGFTTDLGSAADIAKVRVRAARVWLHGLYASIFAMTELKASSFPHRSSFPPHLLLLPAKSGERPSTSIPSPPSLVHLSHCPEFTAAQHGARAGSQRRLLLCGHNQLARLQHSCLRLAVRLSTRSNSSRVQSKLQCACAFRSVLLHGNSAACKFHHAPFPKMG